MGFPAEAFADFDRRYGDLPGVRAVEPGTYQGSSAIIVKVRAGFDRSALPCGFRGYDVLVNDGTDAHLATGPLV